ncbi:type I-F CRISPR-associated endoribonuclease Cas6/Csy4 [Pseudomonas aeruginosa]|nr:type I-F CRISPR-associated endoribonuclease Cas6/Csy4 [Pseudomonas aeruginosa]
MQSLTHYIDLAPHNGNAFFELHGRIVTGAHLSAQDGKPVAIDWPGWKNVPGGFGPVVRLLGEPSAIEHCLSVISPLVEAELVDVWGEVKTVPDNAAWSHGYRRHRKPDKCSPTHQRRLERRARGRGEVYEQPAYGEWLKASHRLPMQSRSTGQHFYIFIKRVSAADLRSAEPCGYGFGAVVPQF